MGRNLCFVQVPCSPLCSCFLHYQSSGSVRWCVCSPATQPVCHHQPHFVKIFPYLLIHWINNKLPSTAVQLHSFLSSLGSSLTYINIVSVNPMIFAILKMCILYSCSLGFFEKNLLVHVCSLWGSQSPYCIHVTAYSFLSPLLSLVL